MKTVYLIILLIILQPFILSANYLKDLQFRAIDVTHTYHEKSKEVAVKREIDAECKNLNIVKDTVFGGDMANETVPKKCKKSFITTLGALQPIQIYGLKTIGELELLEFLERASYEPQMYVLVDARKIQWYLEATIPSAVNIPYTEVKYDKDLPQDFQMLIKTFNIKVIGSPEDKNYDFSQAKTAVIFCNGIWCVQSKIAIKNLLDMGYPKEKLIWYRGGIQDWYLLGFTTIRGDLK
ncbi:MAG: rhodanese-like domain-containing protein [Sulfurimonas sp.]|nr:rhodanese-like domain-containing protein [Sulfurimonas sp.]